MKILWHKYVRRHVQFWLPLSSENGPRLGVFCQCGQEWYR